jgi:two-component system nitrogen regulation response regulator GlnG/two-component system response regulator HydG
VLDSDGEHQRLGEARTRRSNFRLVCATNRRADVLKHDFLSRLAVRVEMPALAPRREDVPLLLARLAVRAAERHGQKPGALALSPDLVAHALGLPLPTNVRELDALILDALHEGPAGNGEIGLPANRRALSRAKAAQPAPAPSREPKAEPTADDIRAALGEASGNVTRAAKALGLSSRYALYRLMQRHGIEH